VFFSVTFLPSQPQRWNKNISGKKGYDIRRLLLQRKEEEKSICLGAR
jgi:hypothetical protein